MYVISQLRKDKTFPGLHKVACPRLLSSAIPAAPWGGNLLEVYDDIEDATKALDEITRKIGPFYAITEISITIGPTDTFPSVSPDSTTDERARWQQWRDKDHPND